MGREIPIQLQEHLDGDATTTCLLLRIDPVDPTVSSYGVTTLDRAVRYDDGVSELLYSAAIGSQPTQLQGSADLSVDNGESTSLMPEFDVPISEADIRAGLYDFSQFTLYLVNYEDLAAGHIVLRQGTLGQITIDENGLSFVNEMRGKTAQLKQSVCEKDSLSCRAIFGSQPVGSSTPGPQVNHGWCGFDATTLLEGGMVAFPGLENTITFTVTAFTGSADELVPGIVKFTTGLNAGKTYEVESNDVFGEITLAIPTPFPIQAGDMLQYRPDCSKMARDADKGCLNWFAADWVLHFRGEPDIPIGDAGAMETPGASSAPGSGGSTNQPFPTVDA